MIEGLVESDARVTLLGASAFDPEAFRTCLALAPVLVAADGAARQAVSVGHIPDAVIGDFDSLDPGTLAQIPTERLHRIDEQDTTDFDKALRSISAPLTLAVGFTGQRLDHELAVYNALVRLSGRPCIVVGSDDICFHAPPRLTLDLAARTRVSLFPMARVTGHSTGLKWPIAGLTFDPAGRIGTSNAAEGPVTLSFSGPGMLVILPRPALEAAVRGLQAATAG